MVVFSLFMEVWIDLITNPIGYYVFLQRGREKVEVIDLSSSSQQSVPSFSYFIYYIRPSPFHSLPLRNFFYHRSALFSYFYFTLYSFFYDVYQVKKFRLFLLLYLSLLVRYYYNYTAYTIRHILYGIYDTAHTR